MEISRLQFVSADIFDAPEIAFPQERLRSSAGLSLSTARAMAIPTAVTLD
jgi:hypothetical protein